MTMAGRTQGQVGGGEEVGLGGDERVCERRAVAGPDVEEGAIPAAQQSVSLNLLREFVGELR